MREGKAKKWAAVATVTCAVDTGTSNANTGPVGLRYLLDMKREEQGVIYINYIFK